MTLYIYIYIYRERERGERERAREREKESAAKEHGHSEDTVDGAAEDFLKPNSGTLFADTARYVGMCYICHKGIFRQNAIYMFSYCAMICHVNSLALAQP
jgi:hypothetical protein